MNDTDEPFATAAEEVTHCTWGTMAAARYAIFSYARNRAAAKRGEPTIPVTAQMLDAIRAYFDGEAVPPPPREEADLPWR